MSTFVPGTGTNFMPRVLMKGVSLVAALGRALCPKALGGVAATDDGCGATSLPSFGFLSAKNVPTADDDDRAGDEAEEERGFSA